MKSKMNLRKGMALLLGLLLVLSLVGCGGASKSDASMNESTGSGAYDSYYDYGFAPEAGDMATDGSSNMKGDYATGSAPEVLNTDKIIYRGEMQIETQDFDAGYAALEDLVEQFGGYFEQSEIYNSSRRRGYFTLRLPAKQFKAFYEQAGEAFHVTSKNYNAQNVSEAYYDLEARLATQRTKLERLQELLKKATTMADIIEIESAISDTELQIEYYTGSLRNYDAKIQYATLVVNLNEVSKLSNTEEPVVGYGARLVSAFQKGWRNFVDGLDDFTIWVAENFAALLIWAAALVIAVLQGRKAWRKKRSKKAVPEVKSEEPKE